MRYDEIFRDITASICRDYAGYEEKKERHDAGYFRTACAKEESAGTLNDRRFAQLMEQYLAAFEDRNLQFCLAGKEGEEDFTRGFEVRSYQGNLYVSRVEQETRLRPGDRIITMNMVPPALHKKRMRKNVLGGGTEEREHWEPFVRMTEHCMVKHADGTDENLTLRQYPANQKLPRLGGRLIGRDTLYLELPHFASEEAVEKLLAAKEKSLNRCRYLILDLRRNLGGMEQAFVPLLDYIFPEQVLLRDLYDEKGLYTNNTVTNCTRKAQMFEAYLASADAATRPLVEDIIRELKEKSGQGMIWEPDEELLEDETLVGGKGNFERIIILSDIGCEYAGETFIELCRKSPRVLVIGRPTMGDIDYCNPVSVLYNGKFTFTYPMSKTKAAAEGRGVSTKGVPVDICIPWTPAECVRDVLLEQALKMR